MLIITLIIISLYAAYYLYNIIFQYWRRKEVTQDAFPVPPFGVNFKDMLQSYPFYELISVIYNRFPNVRFAGFYQFHLPVLMLRDPLLIKQICIKDFEHFLDHRRFLSSDSDPLWSKNLFALKGQKWKEMRTTLSPSFTGSKMRHLFTLMHECTENFVKYFTDNPDDFIEIEMKDTFTRFTNDIIATTAFGLQCDSLKDKDNEFYRRGKQTTDFTGFWRNMKIIISLLSPWAGKFFSGIMFDVDVSNFFRRIIRETIKFREENKVERPDMINQLMHARKGTVKDDENIIQENNFAVVEEHLGAPNSHRGKIDLTLDDITSQALIFFFAGFDTVATAMCFMAFELAANPDIQKRLIEELDDFRKSGNALNYESLTKLTYLDMVLCETLRKWPPSIMTDRQCVKPYTITPQNSEEESVHLSVGDVLMVPIWALHHDPKYWENPEKFDPERFSVENKEKIIPYTYIPFGAGPRNCIGSRFAILEVKAVIFGLLQHFEIVPTEKSDVPFIPNKRSFTLVAKNGFWFGLKKRMDKIQGK